MSDGDDGPPWPYMSLSYPTRPQIHRVLECYRFVKPEAYTPVVVSFGPYHRGKDHLLPMDDHKKRVKQMFLAENVHCEARLHALISILKPCYHGPPNDDVFVQLMVEDGLFLIALLDACARTADRESTADQYRSPLIAGDGLQFLPGDQVFDKKARKYLWPYIRRDMLLLENQIPILLLEITLRDLFPGYWAPLKEGETMRHRICMLILRFFRLPAGTSCNKSCVCRVRGVHVLDVYRNSCIIRKSRQQEHRLYMQDDDEKDEEILERATHLWLSGVTVKQGTTTDPSGFFQVHVENRGTAEKTILIPKLGLDDINESVLLLLLALERLDLLIDDQITLFVKSMVGLVRKPSDCRILLVGYNVSLSTVWTDEAVASFFQKVAKALYPDLQQVLDNSKRTPMPSLWRRFILNIHKYLFIFFNEDHGRMLTLVRVIMALLGIWINLIINFAVKKK